MAHAGQLWLNTDEKCQIGKVRLLCLPDKTPCTLANLYLTSLRHVGRSAGTVSCYASELSSFVRYLAKSQKSIWDVDDDFLCAFSQWLEKPAGRRKARQINRIIHRTLNYLEWIQNLFEPSPALIGTFGDASRVIVKHESRYRGGRTLWHQSLKASDIGHVIEPMTRATFLRLYDAASAITKSKYIVARTRVLLSTYYDTGARRCELCALTVKDVLEASRDPDGCIQITTAKRKGKVTRRIPIPKATLDQLLSFVRVTRATFVNRLIARGVIVTDPGDLFLSQRGRATDPESVTQTFHALKRAAGIKEKVSGHMLRHRYITVQVSERINAYATQRLPVDIGTTLLTKVASLSGHSLISSLKPYLHLASVESKVWDAGVENLSERSRKDARNRIDREEGND